jgi:hypothetical protein
MNTNFVRRDEISVLQEHLEKPGVTSLWGVAGAGKSTTVRSMYYEELSAYEQNWEEDYLEKQPCINDRRYFKMYSWVDISHPFNLRVFCQCLLLDFHSYDLRTRETAAIAMMEGQDPIQGCYKFLREERCLVVIDDLQSTHDWDLIKAALLPDPIKGCMVVITNEESIATYCADEQDQVVMVKFLEAHVTPTPLIKVRLLLISCFFL